VNKRKSISKKVRFEIFKRDNITFKEDMKRTFLSKLSIDEVENAMHIACARMDNAEEALRYFCGICWRRIKGPSANYWRGR